MKLEFTGETGLTHTLKGVSLRPSFVKNYQCVMKGAYLVKNSNAMYQALYDYMANENYSKKRLKEMLRCVPIRYPAFVLFNDQTFDAGRILMDSFHLSRLKYWLVSRLFRRKDR